MTNIRTIQRSFGAGEVSPEFFGRSDDAKYAAGAALMRNFIALPHGPATTRPGFEFVRATRGNATARLIPFTFSTDQTLVLEFTAGRIRFHTAGATVLSGGSPYEVISPYAEADLMDLHYVQSADVLTIVHPRHAPRELRRYGPTNWQWNFIRFNSPLDAPAGVAAAATTATSPSGQTYSYYVVTAVSDAGEESEQSEQVSAWNNLLQTGAYNTITWSTGGGAARYNVYKQQSGIFGWIGQASGGSFTDDNIAPDLSRTPPIYKKPFGFGQILSVPVTAGGSGYSGIGTPESVPLVITDSTGTGASAIGIITGGAITSVQITASGQHYSAPTVAVEAGHGGSGATFGAPTIEPINCPGAVGYFEQRRVFAGATLQPQNIWMTRSGTESNMGTSLPARDDDAIAVRVAARELNTIRHIVPMSSLLLLTNAGEWRVSGGDVITPSTISVKPQSGVGANNVQPLVVNNTVLYGAARGGHVRELAYNWQAGGFMTGDLSLRATHLFDGLEIVDAAYSKAPTPICWFVSSNGDLLGLTYVPEQQVGAWHRHHTAGGRFESIAVVAEGSEDVLYAVVRRTVDGSAVRYIERLHTRQFAEQKEAFFVDGGLTYSGAPATTISGLGHLEGKEVAILADGAVHPRRTVAGGVITLEEPASTVHVGLPIVADLRTLPLAAMVDNGAGSGRAKAVNKAWLRVYRSGGIWVGPSVAGLREAKQRTTEPYGSPPELKSEEVEVALSPSWGRDAQVLVRQQDPLPLTVVALTLEVAMGG